MRHTPTRWNSGRALRAESLPETYATLSCCGWRCPPLRPPDSRTTTGRYFRPSRDPARAHFSPRSPARKGDLHCDRSDARPANDGRHQHCVTRERRPERHRGAVFCGRKGLRGEDYRSVSSCLGDGGGEVCGSTPHRPVPGREVDKLEVAQGGDLGHHRVPCASHLHHYFGGV